MTYILGLPSSSCMLHEDSNLAVPLHTFETEFVVMMHFFIIKVFPMLILESSEVNDIDHCKKITPEIIETIFLVQENK